MDVRDDEGVLLNQLGSLRNTLRWADVFRQVAQRAGLCVVGLASYPLVVALNLAVRQLGEERFVILVLRLRRLRAIGAFNENALVGSAQLFKRNAGSLELLV